MNPPPHIVFLFADQLQAFALGCMGNPDIITPHLDALAADGLLFRHAYSDSPVCTPYRGCLMTGRYPSQSGIRNNGDAFAPDERCLPHALEAAGYATGYVGKWHLGGGGNRPIPRELQAGFHQFLGYQCYNSFVDQVCFYDEEGREYQYHQHRTTVTTNLAMEMVDRIGEEPFALFVSYQNPHYPIEPDPAFAALYARADLQTRPNVDPATEPFTPTFSPRSPRPFERDPNYQRYGGDLAEFQRLYYALVTQLDHEVGRLIRHLKAKGLYDNSLILFTSDHGEMMGSHGRMNKGVPHEESCRVPLIFHAPGIADDKRGRIEERPVSAGIDIWPTLLDFAGHTDPKQVSGTSWKALAFGERIDHPPIFAEHPWPGERDRTWLMVRDGDWKLVLDRDDLTPHSLYHLGEDPFEMHNRLGTDREPLERLSELARDWRETMG